MNFFEKFKNNLIKINDLGNYYLIHEPICWFSCFIILMIPISCIYAYSYNYVLDYVINKYVFLILVLSGVLVAYLTGLFLHLMDTQDYLKNKKKILFPFLILIMPVLSVLLNSWFILHQYANPRFIFDEMVCLISYLVVMLPIVLIIKWYLRIKKELNLSFKNPFLNGLCQIEEDYLKNRKLTWFFIFIFILTLFSFNSYVDLKREILYIDIAISNLLLSGAIKIYFIILGTGLSIFFTNLILLLKNKLNLSFKNSFWTDLCQIEEDYLKNKKLTWSLIFIFILLFFSLSRFLPLSS